MQFNRNFLESADILTLFHEQDANTDITGDWLSLVNYDRAYILMKKMGSEDVDSLGLQILQATSAAGAGAKGVTVSRAWYKTAASLLTVGTWTATDWLSSGVSVKGDFLGFGATLAGGVTYATTLNQRVCDDVNTNPVWILAEIMNTDLDGQNGFKFFTAFLEGDNVDNSCLITADAILLHGKLAGKIPVSAIA